MLKHIFSLFLAVTFFASSSEAQVTTVPVQLPKASLNSTNLLVTTNVATPVPLVRYVPVIRSVRAVPKPVVRRVAPTAPEIQQASRTSRLIGYDQCGRPVYRAAIPSQTATRSPAVRPRPIAEETATESSFSESYPNLDRVNELFEDPFEAD